MCSKETTPESLFFPIRHLPRHPGRRISSMNWNQLVRTPRVRAQKRSSVSAGVFIEVSAQSFIERSMKERSKGVSGDLSKGRSIERKIYQKGGIRKRPTRAILLFGTFEVYLRANRVSRISVVPPPKVCAFNLILFLCMSKVCKSIKKLGNSKFEFNSMTH